MSGSFSYASFTRDSGSGVTRHGGWGVGETSGEIAPMWIDELTPLTPQTPESIRDDAKLPKFPDEEDLARQLRRYAWLPAPWEPRGAEDTGVFFASTRAGADSTGRDNIFTLVHVSDPGVLPRHDAVAWMYSPSLPTPFGSVEVDAAALPTLDAGAAPSSMTDAVLDAFLAGAPSEDAGGQTSLPTELRRVREPSGPASRPEILAVLIELLMNGRPVVLLADPVEGPLWVAAVARALPEDVLTGGPFTWSTYERAGNVAGVLAAGVRLAVVPTRERDRLPDHLAAVIVDTGELLPSADSAVPSEPTTPDTAPAGWQTVTDAGWGAASSGTAPSTPPVTPVTPPVTAPSFGGEPSRPAGGSPAGFGNPFSGITAPEPATTPPVVTPDVAPEPQDRRTERRTPPGTYPALVQLTPDDVAFIRDADFIAWNTNINGVVPEFRDMSPESRQAFQRWREAQLSHWSVYLCLDPSTELGHTLQVRILALLSYGFIPVDRNRPDRPLFAPWTLTTLFPEDREALIADATSYSVTHGCHDPGVPDLTALTDPTLRAMAEDVFRRRTDVRPIRPDGQAPPPNPAAHPVQQIPQHQPFPSAYQPYADRQPQRIPPNPGHPGRQR
ncbi:GAP1-N2 domain-containing protein [Corynebacterium terpenotabidum]|uniref:GTPase-associated protein 1 N-terminal domain-containing protein n=1 Tax=Corynebacterium terpenotabidum Y-11 TaxID=1200352 RepID=S4XDV9_9CORY|nr:hypothetical protein [Corynebacterium terpenotabidum]AGP29780.1 hypothetical protein A606_00625 [Corynebacterium terpenotabidum Y-11]